MKFKITGLYNDQIEKLKIQPVKEVYRKLTREEYIKEYNKWNDYYGKNPGYRPYILDAYKSGDDYFNQIKKNCSRKDNKKFYDVFDDEIIQYEYNYYFNVNSLADIEYLQNIIGGFYISYQEKTISVNEEL